MTRAPWRPADLDAARGANRYHEFLRVPDLSAGVYVLARGATDPQRPHTEDEIYVVLAGRARFQNGERDDPVEPGDAIYVEAGVPHRFHDIAEDLRLLVVFAPADGTRA